MQTRVSTAVFILVPFLLASCMTMGRKIDPAAMDRIQIGTTTRQQVLASMGAPDQVTRNGNEVIYNYMYARSEATAQSFIPVVGGLMGGSKTQNQSATITFGPDDIVKNVNSTMGGMEAGSDLAAGSKARVNNTGAAQRSK